MNNQDYKNAVKEVLKDEHLDLQAASNAIRLTFHDVTGCHIVTSASPDAEQGFIEIINEALKDADFSKILTEAIEETIGEVFLGVV